MDYPSPQRGQSQQSTNSSPHREISEDENSTVTNPSPTEEGERETGETPSTQPSNYHSVDQSLDHSIELPQQLQEINLLAIQSDRSSETVNEPQEIIGQEQRDEATQDNEEPRAQELSELLSTTCYVNLNHDTRIISSSLEEAESDRNNNNDHNTNDDITNNNNSNTSNEENKTNMDNTSERRDTSIPSLGEYANCSKQTIRQILLDNYRNQSSTTANNIAQEPPSLLSQPIPQSPPQPPVEALVLDTPSTSNGNHDNQSAASTIATTTAATALAINGNTNTSISSGPVSTHETVESRNSDLVQEKKRRRLRWKRKNKKVDQEASSVSSTLGVSSTIVTYSGNSQEDWSNEDEYSSCCCIRPQYRSSNLFKAGGTLKPNGKTSKTRKCLLFTRKFWSIRSVVLFVIAASILILGIVVWLLHFVLSKSGERDVLDQTQRTQSGRVMDSVVAYLAVGPVILQTVQKLFQLGEEFVPEISKGTIRTAILVNQIRYAPPNSISIGYETGELEGVQQLNSNRFQRGYQPAANSTLSIDFIDPETLDIVEHVASLTGYDPRLQPWYINPIIDPSEINGTTRGQEQFVWSDPLVIRGVPTTVSISVGMTYRDFATDRLKGVLTVGYDLPSISTFLMSIPVRNNTLVFIVNRKGELIGTSRPPIARMIPLPLAIDHPDRDLRDAYIQVVDHYGTNIVNYPLNATFLYDDQHGDERAVAIQNLRPILGIDWVIVTSVLSKDVASAVMRANTLSIIVSLILIFAVEVIALAIGWLITKPLQSIAESTTRVANMNFSDSKKHRVMTLKFYEFEVIVRAMDQMKKALRNFEKYVPTKVVKSLMDSNKGIRIGVEPMYITIMFLDIADFTSITERTDPSILVKVLEEFFTSMSEVISANQGIIDKYIGDCIMTLFNAPNPVENHEEMAVKSALEMQRRTQQLNEKWAQQPGYPQFMIRIGINTAECLVGNVGSANRVNYTALGDGVHIASNLEGLNKKFKTRIILGEKTYDAVSDKYACLWLAHVAYKETTMHTYTVFDELDCISEECRTLCQLHNQTKEAFDEKNTERMKQLCNEILQIEPSDTSASDLLKRLEGSDSNLDIQL